MGWGSTFTGVARAFSHHLHHHHRLFCESCGRLDSPVICLCTVCTWWEPSDLWLNELVSGCKVGLNAAVSDNSSSVNKQEGVSSFWSQGNLPLFPQPYEAKPLTHVLCMHIPPGMSKFLVVVHTVFSIDTCFIFIFYFLSLLVCKTVISKG